MMQLKDQQVRIKMQKYLAFLLVLCSTQFLCGCVPTIHDYNYLSFEMAEDAKVMKWMDTPPAGVKLKEKVPREYEIRRNDYTIKILLSNERYSKTIYVAIVGGAVSAGYSMEGNRIRFTRIIKNRDAIYKYVFTPGRCTPNSPPHCKPSTELRFSIFTIQGKLLGQETIPFEVKDGGTVFGFDSV